MFSLRAAAIPLAASLGALLLAGCDVHTNKNGKNDNVDIGTPFGSMSVKTNENVSSVGLSVYPGAVPVKGKDSDSDAADINMNFGNFHLGVKAMSYQTGDAQEKVLAYYRKDMAHFGDVIECRGHSSVGTPAKTAQGLSCDDSGNSKSHIDSGGDIELRAGSPSHQHIVGVESKDGGTRIGLVMLNLPTEIHLHDDKQSE